MINLKKIIEITAAIKSFGALVFAGLIMVYTVFGGFFGLREISFSLVWQALFIAITASGLHFIAFTDALLHKTRRGARYLLFALPLYILLAGFAFVFSWFPVGILMNWLIFSAVYLFFFGVVTIVFELYFRVTGQRFTQVLDAYQRKHN